MGEGEAGAGSVGCSQDAPFLPSGLNMGFSLHRPPLSSMVGFGQLEPQALLRQRKAVPASRLLHARMAAAEAGQTRTWSPEKAQALGGLGGAGAGAGTGKRRQRADQDSNMLQAEFQGRDPAYVCTCVSWTSPATSRLLMEGRLVRRW